jgi:hypothetical protein
LKRALDGKLWWMRLYKDKTPTLNIHDGGRIVVRLALQRLRTGWQLPLPNVG